MWTQKYIFDHTGYKVKYFRPPYGESPSHSLLFFMLLFQLAEGTQLRLFKLDCILYSESSYQRADPKQASKNRGSIVTPYLNSILNGAFSNHFFLIYR